MGIDNKLKMSANGVSKYFIADHLGSTNALTDASGAILEQTAFDSFGNVTNQLSTRYAFPGRDLGLAGLASDDEILILADEQREFDANTQDNPYAPMHAMARVGQSREDARRLANLFVRNEICLARKLAAEGYHEESLRRLSRAMHTLQDSTSPAHFDFQEAWDDTGVKSYWKHRNHYISESRVMPSRAELARFQTRQAWYYYKGMKEMPSDFFINHRYDSNSGPVDSISFTLISPDGGRCDCD